MKEWVPLYEASEKERSMTCPICGKEIEMIAAPECDVCGRAVCGDCVTTESDGKKVCHECGEK